MIKKVSYIIILILFFSSCVTSRRVNYLQDLKEKIPVSSTSDSTSYILKTGDRVYVKISTMDEESKKLFSVGVTSEMGFFNNSPDIFSYTIFPDGNIDMPYVGNIKLIGLTTRQAKDTIMNQLKPMIPDCDIDVKLVNAYFSILGVAGSGRYDIIKERLNVFQALALSGDLKSFSDRTRIHVLRQNIEGKTEIKTFDVRNKKIIDSDYYYIQPNDIIYVQSFNGQFFGIESFSSVVSTVSSTFSLAYLLYYYSIPLFDSKP